VLVLVKSVEKRLCLSEVAVHLEVSALLVLAFITTIIQILHSQSRQDLYLRHEPGTIASAVSISAQTPLANLLDGQQKEEDFHRALDNKKFRIDPQTMKILMEGEEGYDQAASPNPRRSIFGALGLGSPGNRRFSSFGLGPISPASK